jgi:hypothetical protein
MQSTAMSPPSSSLVKAGSGPSDAQSSKSS